MCPETVIRRFAGAFTLIAVTMGYFVNPAWLLLGVLVGVNLIQSSVTHFCPLEKILALFGVFGCQRR